MKYTQAKKTLLGIVSVLALFMLVIAAGGCGGSSGGKSDTAKLYKIGEIDAATNGMSM
ncbi:MAG: hypothetical protein RR214_00605 [Synergistaceae bacterium]